jgi:hypothetical protein
MNKSWSAIIKSCKALAEMTGVELPHVLAEEAADGPADRTRADQWMRNGVLLEALSYFLPEVSRAVDKPPTPKTEGSKTEAPKKSSRK